MNDVLLITSANEGSKGISVSALNGSSLASNFKDCVVDSGAMCIVGGSSSFSGQGCSCDYIVAAQSQKPVINVYHWGKSQVYYQCHVQEITTSLACDSSGSYLLGGTKRGWIYLWELASGKLLTSFQAHFKAITQLTCTKRGEFFISASEDGMVRAWDLCDTVSKAEMVTSGTSTSKATGTKPFRSWSPHTLAIKGMHVAEYGSSIRVFTCSLDRSVVLHDLYSNKQCHRIAMPYALSSITCNITADHAFVGGSNGRIYIVDLSLTAATKMAPHAHMTTTTSIMTTLQKVVHGPAPVEAESTSVLDAHSKAVTTLSMSSDGKHLISASEDCAVKVWDVVSHQCLQELTQPRAVSNVVALRRPELLQNSSIYRPKLTPFEHLKKYTENTKGGKTKVFMIPPTIFGSTDSTDPDPASKLGIRTGSVGRDIVGGGCSVGLRDAEEARLGASMQIPEELDSGSEEEGAEGENFVEEEEEEAVEEVPAKKATGKKRVADLTDSTDFLSFGATPASMHSKLKKQK